jgi:hypothetical protein
MILSLVVVIAHITFVFWRINSCSSSAFYSSFLFREAGGVDGSARSLFYLVVCLLAGSKVLGWASEVGFLVLIVVTGCCTETILSELGYDGPGSLTELSFVAVESGLESGSWASNDASFTVVGGFLGVGPVRNVELSFDVSGVGFLVSVGGDDQ